MGELCSVPTKSFNQISHYDVSWDLGKFKLENSSGEIYQQEVDAFVSASNNQLVQNNGRAHSIIAHGGEKIQSECNSIIEEKGILSVGSAVATSAGNLAAKYIIHAVLPIWTGGENCERFRFETCIRNTLVVADELKVESIAFPSLTCGVFGFPKDVSTQIIVNQCIDYLLQNESTTSLKKIMFVNSDLSTARIFKMQIERSFTSKVAQRESRKKQMAEGKIQEKIENQHPTEGESEEITIEYQETEQTELFGQHNSDNKIQSLQTENS